MAERMAPLEPMSAPTIVNKVFDNTKPSAVISASELQFLDQTVLGAGSVFNGVWHTVKISSSNPCDVNPTWNLEFDGSSYTGLGLSVCGRELHMNRHCWSGGSNCASRVN